MCTLSFIPNGEGFLVGMNRDELLSRGAATLPSLHEICGTRSIYPTDIEGGTWIGATESGNCYALLNRNCGAELQKRRSRGELVIKTLECNGLQEVEASLADSNLMEYLPFRLVGMFPSEKQLFEWVWDGNSLRSIAHRWQARHWFSSGLSDEEATESRSRVFDAAWNEPNASEPEWLRRIHQSHGINAGAFSVCVHRQDAASLSYTEVAVARSSVSMSYLPGSPCQNAPMLRIDLPRVQPISKL